MEVFHDLPKEYIEPIQRCFDMLKCCNITFFNDKPFLVRNWRYLYILPCVVAYHLSLSVYMRKVFKGELPLSELGFVVSVYVVCNQSIIKAVIVVSKAKEIRSIIVELGQVWRTKDLNDEQIKKKNLLLKRLNIFYKVFYWMNIIGSWQYILAPLFETLVRRFILQQEHTQMLPFACSFPFDPTDNWFIYIGVYIFEGYSMFRIIYYYLGSEFLMLTLCAHLSTELTLLHEDLRNLMPRRNGDYLYRGIGIRDIVRRHEKLISLSQQLDNIFNVMIFVNLLSATFSICFFSFSAKVARTAIELANNFVAVIASILPIFNLCYYGEQLQEASLGIADSAYHNLWYKGGTHYQKCIYFIIKRSQKPCSLTSMKYNPIALTTFTTVLSTTWSYFSLASSVYDENKV